jgi:Fe-S cluster biogenesis protein NfuA|tara:strand:+ start:348 stop:695 length:348 start_codon:yes stop_codon:yes gene_type:complete
MTERLYEDVVKHITEVMEQYVTPSVAQHGGEVNFVSFEDGVVLVELSGACSGCAGSTMTLKHGIEQMMTTLIPEVQGVEGIDDLFSNVDPYYNSDPFGNALAWEAGYDLPKESED